VLRKKTILLSSSCPWTDVYLSKHNYALELVKAGNIVFFLNPPVKKKLKPGEVVIKQSTIENLFIVMYRPFFPMFLRVKLGWAYNQLMKLQAYLILKKINRKLDIVWDFNSYLLFNDLKVFKADINIFHPVDKIFSKWVNNRNADITFSVSNHILDMVESPGKPKVFINHGLGSHFVSATMGKKVFLKNNHVKVGYVGNLLMHILDHDILKTIIGQHPNIQFHFLGPYEKENSPLVDSSSDESFTFVTFLKSQPNVILHGAVKSQDLVERMKDFDIFLLCYQKSLVRGNYNSHKILEYLSTGKLIVSSFINEYAGKDFILMCKENDTDEFCSLFSEAVNNIDKFNNEDQSKKRIQYALDNTYEMQLKRIENALSHYSILKENINAKLKIGNENFELKKLKSEN